jgi:putative transposase
VIDQQLQSAPTCRRTQVLGYLGIATSSWYRQPSQERKRPGPPPQQVPDEVLTVVVEMATSNPWYGYKRIAVMCRRAGHAVTNRQAYRVMKDHGLLQRKQSRKAEVYQAARLFELLPTGPNQLWQMDVTYVHLPSYGWWYAVTVIDYYSRYLLACYLTSSYSAIEATHGLRMAQAEAERRCGPLEQTPYLVTDNGSSFIAKRFQAFVKESFQQVRIQYRTPQQLGLLERFHQTLKNEEVYWRMYESPQHARECLAEFRERYNEVRPHWALVPEEGGDPYVPAEVYTGEKTIGIPRWQAWAQAARQKLEELIEAA